MDDRFTRRDRRRKEYYNIYRVNVNTYWYQHSNIHLKTSEQVKAMSGDSRDLCILGVIMKQ